MSAVKKAAFGLSVLFATMGTANNAEAQQFARNDNATPARTELSGTFAGNADKTSKANPEVNPKKAAAIIKQAGGGHAEGHSIRNKDILVLYVSGGTKGINGESREAYTAQKYAELLQKEFAKYGEHVAVFYEETGMDRPTGVQILKGGYTLNDRGNFVINPNQDFRHPFLLHGEIPKIVKDHAEQAPAVALN